MGPGTPFPARHARHVNNDFGTTPWGGPNNSRVEAKRGAVGARREQFCARAELALQQDLDAKRKMGSLSCV